MKIAYYKEYSHFLQREMEFKVYGHAGKPCLVFPAQDGRFYDWENFRMVEVTDYLLEEGRLQYFCVDSIDWETWSDQYGDPRGRALRHEAWDHYVVEELVPRIYEINTLSNGGKVASGILTTGCSMGGMHAANFFFRRPDLFDGCISLSGVFNSRMFFGDYMDDIIYNNAPEVYLRNLANDHPYVDLYNRSYIVLCCGQGAWEDEMIASSKEMKRILEEKGIHAWIDFWGYDVNHDWPWWQKQLPYFLEKIV